MLRRTFIRGGLGLGGLTLLAGVGTMARTRLERRGEFATFDGLDAVLFPEDPLQQPLGETFDRVRIPWRARCFAAFSLSAVVLSARTYRNDRLMPLSTVDLALGWGPMSNPVNVAQVEIWQRGRFYFWRLPDAPAPGTDLGMQDVAWNSANMHMIPGSLLIDEDLRALRRHDMVRISGYLCDIEGPGGSWRSSRVRTDVGAGACEIVWVERVRRLAATDLAAPQES